MVLTTTRRGDRKALTLLRAGGGQRLPAVVVLLCRFVVIVVHLISTAEVSSTFPPESTWCGALFIVDEADTVGLLSPRSLTKVVFSGIGVL